MNTSRQVARPAADDNGWTPWKVLFLAAWIAQLVFVVVSADWLPAVVVDEHHGGKTWSRDAYVAITLFHSVLAPWMCTWGVALIARHLQSGLNLPNKEYWLAPERRDATLARLTRALWPLGLLILAVQAGGHAMVMASTLHWAVPEALPIVVGVVWVAALTVWVIELRRSFALPKSPMDKAGPRPRAPQRRPGR